MYEQIRKFIQCLIYEIKREFSYKEDLWTRLCIAVEFDLINKLQKIEIEAKKRPHVTVIIPENSFTRDEVTNTLIIQWLQKLKVNMWSPKVEITELETSLRQP